MNESYEPNFAKVHFADGTEQSYENAINVQASDGFFRIIRAGLESIYIPGHAVKTILHTYVPGEATKSESEVADE